MPTPSAMPTPLIALRPPRRGAPGWAVQAVATAGVGALAFLGASLITTASVGGLNAPVALGILTGPQLGLWLLIVAVLTAACVRAPAAVLAILVVVLAPLATLGEIVAVGDGGMLRESPFGLLVFAWRGAGLAGAALVGAVSGVIARRHTEGLRRAASPAPAATAGLGTRSTERQRLIVAGVSAALLVVGAALIFALPLQWLGIYFQIWGSAPAASPAQGDRYLWTASMGLAALVLAVVAAVLRRGAGMIVLTSLALAGALIGAFVFQVPAGRLWPSNDVPAYNEDFPVCYGTTGDCPGG